MGELSFYEYGGKEKDVTIIDAKGEFEMQDSEYIFHFFCFLMYTGHYKFIIETRELIFAGSDALGVLIKSLVKLKKVHKLGRIALIPNKTLGKIFSLAKCPMFFGIYDSPADAAADMAETGPFKDSPLNAQQHFSIFWNAAQYHRKNENYRDALGVYLSISMQALSKRKPETQAKYWFFRGLCLHNQGEPEAAKESLLLAQGFNVENSLLNKEIDKALQSIKS